MKERYIAMRNQKVLDEYFMYDYAVSKGFNLGEKAFSAGFLQLAMHMNSILEQLDTEYELTLLFNQRGEFIKVIT
jgi:translation elongation factor EF-4